MTTPLTDLPPDELLKAARTVQRRVTILLLTLVVLSLAGFTALAILAYRLAGPPGVLAISIIALAGLALLSRRLLEY